MEKPRTSIKGIFLALGFGVILTITVLGAADFALGKIYDRVKPISMTTTTSGVGVTEPDPDLGYRLRRNMREGIRETINGQKVFEATYTTDEYGRRVTPAGPRKKNADQFLLFFGDSFTFGYGLQDNETLPARVAAALPEYHVYNYAVLGYGPQQMLAVLQSGAVREQVSEPRGRLVYVMGPGPVGRAIGSMVIVNSYASHFPYYRLDGRDELVRAGNFDTARPGLTSLWRLLGSSGFLRYFRIDLPPYYVRRDYVLTARLIEAARAAFLDTFGDGKFAVAVYPLYLAQMEDQSRRVLRELESANIEAWDFSSLLKPPKPDYYLDIKHDRHPSPLSTSIVAKQLVQALRSDQK